MSSWPIIDNLAGIILKNVEGCVVEIGMGSSTYALATPAIKFKRKLYTCDIKLRAASLFEDHIQFEGKSEDFIKFFDDTPAIVFLDGCHDFDVVFMEYLFFREKLLPGGVIFFHDTLPPTEKHLSRGACSNSYLVRQELEQIEPNCFTWPYSDGKCGLTMILKREDSPPYYRA